MYLWHALSSSCSHRIKFDASIGPAGEGHNGRAAVGDEAAEEEEEEEDDVEEEAGKNGEEDPLGAFGPRAFGLVNMPVAAAYGVKTLLSWTSVLIGCGARVGAPPP